MSGFTVEALFLSWEPSTATGQLSLVSRPARTSYSHLGIPPWRPCLPGATRALTRGSLTASHMVTRCPHFMLFPLQGEFKHSGSMSLPSSMGLFTTSFVLLEKVRHLTHKLPCLLRHPADYHLVPPQPVDLLHLNHHLLPARVPVRGDGQLLPAWGTATGWGPPSRSAISLTRLSREPSIPTALHRLLTCTPALSISHTAPDLWTGEDPYPVFTKRNWGW